METIDDVLNEEVTTNEPAEQQIEQPNEAETTQANADDSKEVTESTGETEATSTPEVENDQVSAFKQAAIDERHKRQQLEQQLNQLRQQQEKPDFWENPDQALGAFAQSMQGQMRQMVINNSVEMMRMTHEDYDAKEESFIQMAQQNPALIAEMNNSANPAKFAYDYATTQAQIKEAQDPQYREKLKAEIRAELEAEQKQKLEAEIQKRSNLPGTLSNDRASGGNTVQPWSQPSANDLYGS